MGGGCGFPEPDSVFGRRPGCPAPCPHARTPRGGLRPSQPRARLRRLSLRTPFVRPPASGGQRCARADRGRGEGLREEPGGGCGWRFSWLSSLSLLRSGLLPPPFRSGWEGGRKEGNLNGRRQVPGKPRGRSRLRGPEGRERVSGEQGQDGAGAGAPAPWSWVRKPTPPPPGARCLFRRVQGLYQMYKGNGNVLTNGQNLSVLLWVPSTTSGKRKPEETRSHTHLVVRERRNQLLERLSGSLKFVFNLLEFAAESYRNC